MSVNTIDFNDWSSDITQEERLRAADTLEYGGILLFPKLGFLLSYEEKNCLLLQPPKAKNISYHILDDNVRGLSSTKKDLFNLKQLLNRYCKSAESLIQQLCPKYKDGLEIGLTSLRTIEAKGRMSRSYRQDDSRLHVDAFPSRPTRGKRILRVFCNINPCGNPRVWHTGESFHNVAERFGKNFRYPSRLSRHIKYKVGITRDLQSLYDSCMLQLHHAMKYDDDYQRNIDHHVHEFPAGTTWIVFSDQVSHAVISGQHLLEQTFYLSVDAMYDKTRSPLAILESLTGKILVS